MQIIPVLIFVIVVVFLVIATTPSKCEKCGTRKERIEIPIGTNFQVVGDFCPKCDEKEINELHRL